MVICWAMLSELIWSGSALTKLAPLEAILFDIDGTLCDSDPIHFCAFRELLQQVQLHAAMDGLWLSRVCLNV